MSEVLFLIYVEITCLRKNISNLMVYCVTTCFRKIHLQVKTISLGNYSSYSLLLLELYVDGMSKVKDVSTVRLIDYKNGLRGKYIGNEI